MQICKSNKKPWNESEEVMPNIIFEINQGVDSCEVIGVTSLRT